MHRLQRTSSPDLRLEPRGLDFLFNVNRLNVALSRARGLSIVVASPALLTAHCRRPEDIRRLNALCTVARLPAPEPVFPKEAPAQ